MTTTNATYTVHAKDDLWCPGFKSRSGREFSVGWTNGRYAMRLISRTVTEGPPVSTLNCDSYDNTAGQNINRKNILASKTLYTLIWYASMTSSQETEWAPFLQR